MLAGRGEEIKNIYIDPDNKIDQITKVPSKNIERRETKINCIAFQDNCEQWTYLPKDGAQLIGIKQ